MFGRLLRSSMPICGMCSTRGNNTFQCLKQSLSKLEVTSTEKRYINVSFASYSNKQNPKQKQPEQLQNDHKKDEETHQNPIKNNPDKKKDSSSDQQNQQKEETDENYDTSEDSNTTSNDSERKKRTKSTIESSIVLHTFANAEKKEKNTFLECLKMYEKVGGAKRERVPFIYAALKYMEEFNVHKDLTVYKKIIDIFPKEKMIPTNQFQTMFMHYPREQYCGVSILEKMEDNGVIPDSETEQLLLNIFGRHGLPLQKYWKMMYWMPKFKHLNPWPVPNPIPNDPYELAKLAMEKISSIDVRSEITIFDTEDVEDSIDKTWIVSAMSPVQSELLMKHNKNVAIFVEGPFVIYVATKSVDYFTLRADPIHDRKFPDFDPDDVTKIRNPYLDRSSDVILPPTVHEQVDATIFANCATGTSTKDSLLSWVRCLQKSNPVLGDIPIIFRLENYVEEETPYIEGEEINKQINSDDSNKDKFLK